MVSMYLCKGNTFQIHLMVARATGGVKKDSSYEEELVKILDRREEVLRNKTIPFVKVLRNHHGIK